MELLIVFASVAVAAGRFGVKGHGFSWPGTYEAFAHIWVGCLIGLAWCAKDRHIRKLAWLALAVITTIEVAAAVWLK